MFYIITIGISILILILFFYCKNKRTIYNSAITLPIWIYLVWLLMLFIPLGNIVFTFTIFCCLMLDSDVELKNKKKSIGVKIKKFLNKRI